MMTHVDRRTVEVEGTGRLKTEVDDTSNADTTTTAPTENDDKARRQGRNDTAKLGGQRDDAENKRVQKASDEAMSNEPPEGKPGGNNITTAAPRGNRMTLGKESSVHTREREHPPGKRKNKGRETHHSTKNTKRLLVQSTTTHQGHGDIANCPSSHRSRSCLPASAAAADQRHDCLQEDDTTPQNATQSQELPQTPRQVRVDDVVVMMMWW
jgi:hypothetical protein